MSSGSAFHADGPACEKARSPNLVHKRLVPGLQQTGSAKQYKSQYNKKQKING